MNRRTGLTWCILLSAVAFCVACSSPNRGTWRGTFDGSVSGVVEFRINARGTTLEGSLDGETSDGAPFEAVMEGRITGNSFYATFEGDGRSGIYPVPFEGFLKGQLIEGHGGGEWENQLETPLGEPLGAKMVGDWQVAQIHH